MVSDCTENLADEAPLVCSECKSPIDFRFPLNKYMLTEETWLRVHPEGHGGFLCHICLPNRAEVLLGRQLTVNDFTMCACFVNRQVHGLTAAEAYLMASMRLRNLSSMYLTSSIVDSIIGLREDEKQEDRLAILEQIDVTKAFGVVPKETIHRKNGGSRIFHFRITKLIADISDTVSVDQCG